MLGSWPKNHHFGKVALTNTKGASGLAINVLFPFNDRPGTLICIICCQLAICLSVSLSIALQNVERESLQSWCPPPPPRLRIKASIPSWPQSSPSSQSHLPLPPPPPHLKTSNLTTSSAPPQPPMTRRRRHSRRPY